MGFILKNTHGEIVGKLSQELNIPYTTVESVLRGYTGELQSILLRGGSVSIPCVVNLSVVKRQSGCSLKAKASDYLAQELRSEGCEECGS